MGSTTDKKNMTDILYSYNLTLRNCLYRENNTKSSKNKYLFKMVIDSRKLVCQMIVKQD